MNRATTPSLFNSQANPFYLRTSLFHSTPVLDRRRRTHWDSRSNHYSKRFRKLHSKETLLRNVSAFAEHLFQSWQNDFDGHDPSSRQGRSWFRVNSSRRGWTSNKGPQTSGKRVFHFCEDDSDIDNIYRSAFGGNRYFYCSFVDEDFPQWRSTSGYYSRSFRTSWNWTHQDEEDYDSSTEFDSSETDLVSYRLALGLSASGPLKMEDVKNAYRSCALKWHPDRHHGASKAVAEEKFKTCSAAYQSLCDKLDWY